MNVGVGLAEKRTGGQRKEEDEREGVRAIRKYYIHG